MDFFYDDCLYGNNNIQEYKLITKVLKRIFYY